jgi:hypothetical protein
VAQVVSAASLTRERDNKLIYNAARLPRSYNLSDPMNTPSVKLTNVLIGKAVIEILLVGVIAVVSYINLFPPTFHGWGEAVPESKSVAGWAVNNAEPWGRVEVQLFIDDNFFATQLAQSSRPDVQAAGWSKDEWHGYEFKLPNLQPGHHEARVYALHAKGNAERYTLQLLGGPITFEIGQNGEWRIAN